VKFSDKLDDDFQLSASALAALLEVSKQHELDKIKLLQPLEHLTILDFNEDWQLSQFWHDDKTTKNLKRDILKNSAPRARIACVSSPTCFLALRAEDRDVHLFEFDDRFSVFTNFHFYDYRTPFAFESLESSFDFVVLDPPFLAEECFLKSAATVSRLLKPGGNILISTGVVLEPVIAEFGCWNTEYQPIHANGLANEFRVFVNYDSQLGKVELGN
jgi:hypothetical protein